MKILLAVHNYPPEFRGGVERAVEALAEEHRAVGHEVLVLTGSATLLEAEEESRLEREEVGGIAVRRWRRSSQYINPVDVHDPRFEAALEDLLDEFQPEVFHLHHWQQLSTGLVSAARRRGIAALATLHDHWTTCARFFRMPGESFCRALEGAGDCLPCLQEIWAVDEAEMAHAFSMRTASLDQEMAGLQALTLSSQSHFDLLRRYGRFPEDIWAKVRVLPMGTSTKVDAAMEVPVKNRRDRLVVAHWGNLSTLKGVAVLAEAAALVSGTTIELRFFGRSVEEELEDRIRDLAGAGVVVTFSGPYDPDDLGASLQDIDVACFPSLAYETHSLVMDEALALQLPVIVSDRGAPAERLGGAGISVPAGDAAALARALEEMSDPDFRRRCSESPNGLVDRRDWAAAMRELYADLIAERSEWRQNDLGRERLAWRNDRLAEIGRFVGALAGQKATVEAALFGDEAALASLLESAPELAARVQILLSLERTEGS